MWAANCKYVKMSHPEPPCMRTITFLCLRQVHRVYWCAEFYVSIYQNNPGPLFTKQKDILPHSFGIYASVNRAKIGSDNGLPPIWRQAIIWTNAGLLSIEPLETYFNKILIKIQNFSFTKMHLKISSAKWRPFCPGGEVPNPHDIYLDLADHPERSLVTYWIEALAYKCHSWHWDTFHIIGPL